MTVQRVYAGFIGAMVFVWFAALAASAAPAPQVSVVVGSQAPELERFAASELCRYLDKLFHVKTQPAADVAPAANAVFLIGSPQTNPAVKTAAPAFPKVSDQGIVLRRVQYQGHPALVVGGGSSAATLWAVYELVQRWGVRYLLEGDVFPEHAGAFSLPDLNVVMEPVFRVRAHPTIQDLVASGEAWGLADFRRLIDQLAKLKFNRLDVFPFGFQPYLDWQCDGIKRSSAWLFYGFHYPIRPDMPGRALFGNASEFWNPDFPITSDYHALVTAGEKQIHELISHAHERGMKTALSASVVDFPPEFAPLLKDSELTHQFGGLGVVAGKNTPLDDPSVSKLASAVLRATIDTFPQTDYVTVYMPEHHQWTGEYEEAWNALDKKYGINQVITLDTVLDRVRQRKGGTISTERALGQVRGDIDSLYFYDGLLRNSTIIAQSKNPHVKVEYQGVQEELYPIVGKVLPHGWELDGFADNFPAHLLLRQEVLKELPTQEIPATMHLTVDDDNIGLVPQIYTDELYPLMQDLRRDGWAGVTVRERNPGDHDSTVAYLARAMWEPDVTPDAVIGDQLRAVCGEACGEDMAQVFKKVEKVTMDFENDDRHFAFLASWPPPIATTPGGPMLKFWTYGEQKPMPPYLEQVKNGYQEALDAAERALPKSTPAGREYVRYWIGRLKFSVGYVETVEDVVRASATWSANNHQQAIDGVNEALKTLRAAVEAYAQVARNPTDRAAIALVDEDGYHSLEYFSWHLQAWGF